MLYPDQALGKRAFGRTGYKVRPQFRALVVPEIWLSAVTRKQFAAVGGRVLEGEANPSEADSQHK